MKKFSLLLIAVCVLQTSAWCQEYRFVETLLVTDGFGNSNITEFNAITYFDGYFYAGTRNDTEGAAIYRSSDGSSWDAVATSLNGFGDSANIEIGCFCAWNGSLYATTRNYTRGSEVWRSLDGVNWAQVNQDGFGVGAKKARQLVVYQNRLFAGTEGARVFASSDGVNWSQINETGFGGANTDIASMMVYDGYIYCGTETDEDSTGVQVWRFNGSVWEVVVSDGFGSSDNTFINNFNIFHGYLYASVEQEYVDNATVWRSRDGEDWSQVGEQNSSVLAPLMMVGSYDEELILGLGLAADRTGIVAYFSFDGLEWRQARNCDDSFLEGIPLLLHNGSYYGAGCEAQNCPTMDLLKIDIIRDGCVVKGDVNGDGKIGLEEALYSLQTLVGQ